MRLLRNYIYKRKLKALSKSLERQLEGPQPMQSYLPLCYNSWVRFWNDTKGPHTYIVLPELEETDNQLIFKNIPHVWHKEFIRQKAIDEASEGEDYELAQRIKEE